MHISSWRLPAARPNSSAKVELSSQEAPPSRPPTIFFWPKRALVVKTHTETWPRSLHHQLRKTSSSTSRPLQDRAYLRPIKMRRRRTTPRTASRMSQSRVSSKSRKITSRQRQTRTRSLNMKRISLRRRMKLLTVRRLLLRIRTKVIVLKRKQNEGSRLDEQSF